MFLAHSTEENILGVVFLSLIKMPHFSLLQLMDSRDRLRYELDCEKLAMQDLVR